jgi:hypothetical protein
MFHYSGMLNISKFLDEKSPQYLSVTVQHEKLEEKDLPYSLMFQVILLSLFPEMNQTSKLLMVSNMQYF